MKSSLLKFFNKYKRLLPPIIIIFTLSFLAGYIRYTGIEVFSYINNLAERLRDLTFLIPLSIAIVFFSFYVKTFFLYLENFLGKYPVLFGVVGSLTVFFLGLGNLYICQVLFFDLIILVLFCILFALNFFIFKLIPKGSGLITQEELAKERTSQTIQRIYKCFSRNSIQTIQITGDWGSGKTHVLKSLYNDIKSKKNSEFIPIYIPLDQINSTDTFISQFKKDLSEEIFSVCGYKSSIELSHIINAFYQKEGISLAKIINILFEIEPSTFKDFNKLSLLKDRQVLVIIDDCDRILTIQELKFVLEFILYLRNYSTSFKIIFAANNKHIAPFIGHHLITSSGEIDADALESFAQIAYNTDNAPNTISRIFSTNIDNNTIFALGDLFLDKFRDIQILVDPLSDEALLDIFFEQLKSVVHAKEIDLSLARKNLKTRPLPFKGDFRLMKRLLALLTNMDLSTIKQKNLDIFEILILGFYYVNSKKKLVKEDIRYLKDSKGDPYFYIEAGDVEAIKSLINDDREYHENSIRNEANLSQYLDLIFI